MTARQNSLDGCYLEVLPNIYIVGSGNPGFGLSHDCDCHVYLIDGGEKVAVIDTGTGMSSQDIFKHVQYMVPHVERVDYVFLTHGHADHAGGAIDFKAKYGSTIFLSVEEAEFLETGNEDAIGLTLARRAGFYPSDYSIRRCPVDVRLKGGEALPIGRYELEAIKTPGHSKGCISYLLHGHSRRVLFVGDTLFVGGAINLLNCPGSDLADYRAYIGNLKDLKVDALLPGHGMFCLSRGQVHIDKCIRELAGLTVPKLAF